MSRSIGRASRGQLVASHGERRANVTVNRSRPITIRSGEGEKKGKNPSRIIPARRDGQLVALPRRNDTGNKWLGVAGYPRSVGRGIGGHLVAVVHGFRGEEGGHLVAQTYRK